MRRVAVIGCGGAGRTTLARRIGAALEVPVVHSDFYRPGWEEAHAELIARDEWLIDAMRLSTLAARLARADTVVFLDRGAAGCLWGIVRRRRRYRGGLHDDGVADVVSWQFVRWVLGFRRRHRPRIVGLLAEHASTTDVVVLRSLREADAFAASLERRGEALRRGEQPRFDEALA